MDTNEAVETSTDIVEAPGNNESESAPDRNSDEATSQEEPNRRNRRAERRIARLTARNAELAEIVEKERQRFEKIEQRLDSLAQPQARPQRENYESEEDYEDAVADYRLDIRKPEPQKAETSQQAVDQQLIDKFQAFIEDADKVTPGFADLVSKASFPLSDHGLAEIIEMGEDGADVFTHLNQTPAEAMRISRLSAREQTIELEKIADKLDVKSSAPDPIEPISGNDQPVVDESNLSTEDWIARRNKKVYGR